MVTVLPSLAAIEPRSRVGGLCAMAVAAATKATAAATQPASRRMGVIGILPKDCRTVARKPPGGCLRLRDGCRTGTAGGGGGAGASVTTSSRRDRVHLN